MKLTTREILKLQAAFGGLEGYEVSTLDGERPRVIRKFYSFGGDLLMSLAKNMNAVDAVADAYKKAMNKLILSLANPGEAKVADANQGKFVAEQEKLLDIEHEITLDRLKVDDLKLDKNLIPASVIAAVEPLLIRSKAKPAAAAEKAD